MKLQEDGFAVLVALERRQPVPEWFNEEPPLHEGGRFFLEAFDALHTCRPAGLDLGRIPWTAINEWARSRGLDREMTRVLEAVIMHIDLEWLAEVKRRRENSGG